MKTNMKIILIIWIKFYINLFFIFDKHKNIIIEIILNVYSYNSSYVNFCKILFFYLIYLIYVYIYMFIVIFFNLNVILLYCYYLVYILKIINIQYKYML